MYVRDANWDASLPPNKHTARHPQTDTDGWFEIDFSYPLSILLLHMYICIP